MEWIIKFLIRNLIGRERNLKFKIVESLKIN